MIEFYFSVSVRYTVYENGNGATERQCGYDYENDYEDGYG